MGKLLRRGWSLQKADGGPLELRHEEKGIEVPVNTERNSLQLAARIFTVTGISTTTSPMRSTSPTARIFALTGFVSKYVQELEMAPGWHRLPNAVVVYSDPIALRLADPKDSIEKAYKSRMTLVKQKNGQWAQLEKVDDINAGGSEMFRKIGINDEPQRTLSFFAPSRFKDYWEHDSEVPISPFPEPEDVIQTVEWSEDDAEEIEDMEQQAENQDIEKLVIAKHPHEVELDETMFSEKTSVKDLQVACKERNLPYTGSKKRLLERLMSFKINIETQMQLSIANKIYKEQQRIPVTIGQPKLPSFSEQERHFITHMPYAGWCQACVASRAKEDKHVNREEQEGQGKNLIQMDFCYTYTGEDQRGDEPTLGKVQERQDQFGTCLILTRQASRRLRRKLSVLPSRTQRMTL